MADAGVVIFDVFETLVHFVGDQVSSSTWDFMCEWSRYRGIDLSPIELRDRHRALTAALLAAAPGDPPDIDVREAWAGVLNSDAASQLVLDACLTWRQITTERLSVYDGTFEMLTALGHHRLAVVSNTQRAYTEAELRLLGLDHHFEVVVFSSDVRACKPDSAPFERALALLDVSPSACVYVGDNPYDDVVGARRVGLPVVHLDRGHPNTAMAGLPTPDAKVVGTDPAGVVRAVEALLAA